MITSNHVRNPDPLLDGQEAAEYLGAHPRTLANQRCRGEGPDFVRIGRQIRYPRSSLDRYIKSRTVTLNDMGETQQ